MKLSAIARLSLDDPGLAKRALAVILCALTLAVVVSVDYLSSSTLRNMKKESLLRSKELADDLSTLLDSTIASGLDRLDRADDLTDVSAPPPSEPIPGTLLTFRFSAATGFSVTGNATADGVRAAGDVTSLLRAHSDQIARRLRATPLDGDPARAELLELDSTTVAVFRVRQREGTAYLQGVVLAWSAFLDGMIGPAFRSSELFGRAGVIVTRESIPLLVYRRGDDGTVARSAATQWPDDLLPLHSSRRLPPPFERYELRVLGTRVDLSRIGGNFVLVAALFLGVVVPLALLGLYSVGAQQIDLTKQRSDFAASVSHELRTPLAALMLRAEALTEGWVSETDRAKFYSIMLDDTRRLTGIVENILQLTEMSGTKSRPEIPREEILSVIRETLPSMQSRITESGFKVTEQLHGSSAVTLVNAQLLSLVVRNLIDNSMKFSRDAERKEIVLSLAPVAGGVAFSVRDFGPGVSSDSFRFLGEIFRRGNDELTRRTRGTGIGLALVRQCAERMGAILDFANASPGFKVTVTLPQSETPAK